MPFIQKVRVLFKTRLIFPRINGPIVTELGLNTRKKAINRSYFEHLITVKMRFWLQDSMLVQRLAGNRASITSF